MFKYPPRSLEMALVKVLYDCGVYYTTRRVLYDGQFMWVERPMREVEG